MMNKLGMTAVALVLGLCFSMINAWSQSTFPSYPNRPIHLIVPFPPGGAVDPIARTLAQKLEEAWGQPIIIDNKPGAATIIGTDFVAKANPDGYTMILVSTSFTVNPAAYSKLPFDPIKDFTPISLVSKLPLILVVNPQLPVKSVAELIEYLKSRPAQVNFSSIGNGTTQQLAGELFKSMAGVNIVHVPYKGSGPSMMSVVSGETSMTFDSIFLLMPQVKAGKLRALASTGTQATPLAPDLPSVSGSGLSGFNVGSWVGLLAPAATPKEIAQKWQRETALIMQMNEIRSRQSSLGLEPIGSTQEYFGDFIKSEIAKWGAVVKQAGIQLE